MADPLSVAAGVIAILQLSSKAIAYINSAKGEKSARRRLRDELRSCEFILRKIKDHAEDLEDKDLFLETFNALHLENAPLHRLKIMLEFAVARLEPKAGVARAVSFVMWPFSERELDSLVAGIGREMSLLGMAMNNNSLQLLQANAKASSKNTSELKGLIQDAKDETMKASTDSSRQIEHLIHTIGFESTSAWALNTAQLDELRVAIGTIEHSVEDAKVKTSEFTQLIKEVKQKSERSDGKDDIIEILKSVKDSLFEHQVQRARQFERLIDSVNNIALGSSLSSDQAGVSDRDVDQMVVDQAQSRNLILKWFHAVDYSPQQYDYFNRRQSGTGEWLLQSKTFLSWMEPGNALLCCGIPGAGKTIMTALVVNYLQRRFEDTTSIGVAYIYCNFKRSHEQRAVDLLASILKQIIKGPPRLPEYINTLYKLHSGSGTTPSIEEYSLALHAIVPLHDRVFVIIDALDECQRSFGNRNKFMSDIFRMLELFGINVFATSRFDPEITDLFSNYPQLEIRAQDEDVELYINAHVQDFPRCLRGNLEFQHKVKGAIVKAVDGRFLLVQLHLDSLRGKRTLNAVLKATNDLPIGTNASEAYNYAYDEAMERINRQDKDDVKLARTVLAWIVCSKRPLNIMELQIALSVKNGSFELDEKDMYSLEDLLSVCAGLVTYNETDCLIRLVHYTTQQYFTRTKTKWFADVEADLARACMTYLKLDDARNTSRTSSAYPKKTLISFSDYALYNWGHHARSSSFPVSEIVTFLNSKQHLNASSKFILHLPSNLQAIYSNPWNYPKYGWTTVHLAVYFGLLDVVVYLLNDARALLNTTDPYKRTPLHIAVLESHHNVVETLLAKKDVQPNIEDVHGRTAFSHAVEKGSTETVTLFMSTDTVMVNCKCSLGRTLLSYAANNGDITTVKRLLDRGAVGVDSKDSQAKSPLWYAARNGSHALVRFFVDECDSNPECRDDVAGHTPLSISVVFGHISTVRFLVNSGRVNINCQTIRGQTPLFLATTKWPNPDIETVKFLLCQSTIKPNLADCDQETPILAAMHQWNKDLIYSILKNSAVNINCGDKSGKTLLLAAVQNQEELMVEKLLERPGTDPNGEDLNRKTPLLVALLNENQTIIDLLFAHPTIQFTDKGHHRPILFCAINAGNRNFVQELLAHPRIDPNCRNSWGLTPLMHAIRQGYKDDDLVGMLLNHSTIDPNCQNEDGVTPLHLAVSRPSTVLLEALLAHKSINPNCITQDGRTPLFIAVECNHEKTVALLLKHPKIDPNRKPRCNHNRLRNANISVLLKSIQLKLNNSTVNLNCKPRCNQTSLTKAIEGGNREIVKLLLLHPKLDLNISDELCEDLENLMWPAEMK